MVCKINVSSILIRVSIASGFCLRAIMDTVISAQFRTVARNIIPIGNPNPYIFSFCQTILKPLHMKNKFSDFVFLYILVRMKLIKSRHLKKVKLI